MTTDIAKPSNIFLLMDKEDEKQIVNPYDFANDKKLVYEVRGNFELSYLAIKHLALLMANKGHPLETIDSKIEIVGEDKEKTWYAKVKVKNQTTNLIVEGISECPFYDETGKQDHFARTKAHSKATRNAIRQHIPERLITKAIEDAKKKGDVKKLEPKSTQKLIGEP